MAAAGFWKRRFGIASRQPVRNENPFPARKRVFLCPVNAFYGPL
jgi:hypothetical protein